MEALLSVKVGDAANVNSGGGKLDSFFVKVILESHGNGWSHGQGEVFGRAQNEATKSSLVGFALGVRDVRERGGSIQASKARLVLLNHILSKVRKAAGSIS